MSGEWVALLDHDDIVAPHALALFALAIGDHPEAGVIYSDEDKLDESGKRRDPFFKPNFDPLLLLGQNFVSHFSAFRKDLVDRVGGYRVGYEGSQDWDLTLRITELLSVSQVIHVPHVLYHWRVHASSTASVVSAKPYAVDAGQRAVVDHLERTARRARTTRIGQWGFNRVTFELPDPPPKVSVIIPTRDGDRLTRCIDSVLAFTIYPDFEVLVVDNGSQKRSTMEYLRANEHRITVIRDDRPFNHSALNNMAVAQSSGEIVCLLNDDTEVIGGGWLSEMVSQVIQPGVGAVGGKLYYGDGRVQHAGVILGVHGVAAHAHRNFDRLSTGYFGHLQLAHRMSGVTAACMVVRREAWRQISGFDEPSLPNVLNDVDLCLRLRQAGWDIVWTPYAELFHHESTSRGIDNEGPASRGVRRSGRRHGDQMGHGGSPQRPVLQPQSLARRGGLLTGLASPRPGGPHEVVEGTSGRAPALRSLRQQRRQRRDIPVRVAEVLVRVPPARSRGVARACLPLASRVRLRRGRSYQRRCGQWTHWRGRLRDLTRRVRAPAYRNGAPLRTRDR